MTGRESIRHSLFELDGTRCFPFHCACMPSAVIRTFEYDPATQRLSVEFQSGRRYAYLDVPELIYRDMKRAFSKGDYFNAHIREHLELERLQPPSS